MSIIRNFVGETAIGLCPCGKGRIVKSVYSVTETKTTWGHCYYEYSIDCECCNQKYDIDKYGNYLKDKVSGEIINLDTK